jgi:hypothetical protein
MPDYKLRGHREAQMIPLMISAAIEVKGRGPRTSISDNGKSEHRAYLARLVSTRALRNVSTAQAWKRGEGNTLGRRTDV